MKKLTWIASYPKSGNTWLRIFLANLASGSDAPVDINSLENTFISSSKRLLENETGYDIDLMTLDEIELLLPRLFTKLANSQENTLPIKTHHAFKKNKRGEWLIPPEATQAAIYLIRNPLDIAVSFARHLGHPNIDTTIETMARNNATLAPQSIGFSPQFPHRLDSWSQHVQSWADAPINSLVIRYEDLSAEPIKQFTKIAKHLELEYSAAQIQQAVQNSSFELVSAQETNHGFKERPSSSSRFFHSGISGTWRNILNKRQIDSIIQTHGDTMKHFAYLDANGVPL